MPSAPSDGKAIKQEGGEGTKNYSSFLARATAASALRLFTLPSPFAAASDNKATTVQVNGKEGREYTNPFGRYITESPFARIGTSSSAAVHSMKAPSTFAKAHDKAAVEDEDSDEWEDVEDGDLDVDEDDEDDWEDIEDDWWC